MMGSSRPTDHRISSVGEALGVLRLLISAEGLKQVTDDLQKTYDQIVASLAAEIKKTDGAMAALVQQRKDLGAASQTVAKKDADLLARARDIADREAVISAREAAATEAAVILKADQDALATGLADLETAKTDFNRVMTGRAAELEAQHNDRAAQFAAAQSGFTEQAESRQQDLDRRQTLIENALKDLAARAAEIAQREKEVAQALWDAEVLKAQHQDNLDELQKFLKAKAA